MKTMIVRMGTGVLMLALSACANTNANRAELVRYDLDIVALPAVPVTPPRIEVRAPAWLQTSAMQYKFAYADPVQRRSYASARWVATPPELLEAALRRGLAWPTRWAACRIQFELDEFIQLFASADSGTAVIELRGRLLVSAGKVLDEQSWSMREASTADAAGGAAAHAGATKHLLTQAKAWLSRHTENVEINKQCSTL